MTSVPSAPAPVPRWFSRLLLLLWLGYVVFVGFFFSPVAGGSDSGGYLNSARFLAHGHFTGTIRTIPEFPPETFYESVPLGTIGAEGTTRLTPGYPVGMPIHFALFGLIFGWKWGIVLVGALGAGLAVWLCHLCLRDLAVPAGLAAAGAATLALSPMFLFSVLQPMSDALSATWCMAAVFAAMRARRAGARWAAAGGAAFAVAVLVRPTNLILAPVLLLLLLGRWRLLFAAVAGGLPGAAWLGFYNHTLYGSAFSAGYGNMSAAFSWQYVGPTLVHYATWVPRVLPAVWLVPVTLPFLAWRTRGREYAAVILWLAVFAALYSAYFCTYTTWWYLRFLVPAAPAISVLMACGLRDLLERVPARGRRAANVTAAALVAGVLGVSVYWTACQKVLETWREQRNHTHMADWVRAHVPHDALVACMQGSTTIYFYTDLPIVRWDGIAPERVAALVEALKKSGRPFYAVMFPFEIELGALTKHLPVRWEKIADFEGIGVWKCVSFVPPESANGAVP